MSPFKILLALTVLLSFQALNNQAFAGFDDDDSTRSSSSRSHESDDDYSEYKNKVAKEKLKKLLEMKKKKEAEKKKRKSRSSSGSTVPVTPPTQSGSTQTGSTQTGTTQSSTKTATVNYNVPGDNVPVTFTVTVQNGTITAASSTTKIGGTSGYYQDAFATNISKAAVGKKASGLSLSAVGGASLTTRAFNQFVAANF